MEWTVKIHWISTRYICSNSSYVTDGSPQMLAFQHISQWRHWSRDMTQDQDHQGSYALHRRLLDLDSYLPWFKVIDFLVNSMIHRNWSCQQRIGSITLSFLCSITTTFIRVTKSEGHCWIAKLIDLLILFSESRSPWWMECSMSIRAKLNIPFVCWYRTCSDIVPDQINDSNDRGKLPAMPKSHVMSRA